MSLMEISPRLVRTIILSLLVVFHPRRFGSWVAMVAYVRILSQSYRA